MNRTLPLIVLLLVPLWADAQLLTERNSIRLGIDITSLDDPDDVGRRLTGRLANLNGAGISSTLGAGTNHRF